MKISFSHPHTRHHLRHLSRRHRALFSTFNSSSQMSLSLASTAVSAALCPTLPVNLLHRTWASTHDVGNPASVTNLPITVSFLSQDITTSFPFIVVDKDFGFDVLLGRQWESWCMENRG